MKANPSFNKIVLMGRAGVPGVNETLQAIYHHLTDTLGLQVFCETTSAELFGNTVAQLPANELAKHAELIIVVGGDGSLINAAHLAVDQKLPVLGINRGRLGFLTDIHPNNLEKITEVVNGQYISEQRFLLDAKIFQNDKLLQQNIALNEAVLLPGDVAQMIEFELFVNQQFVTSHRADGIIIATPTGSTAYALSGGGPILHPQLNAIVIVPMFPHTLSSRPIVIDGNSDIELRISQNNKMLPYLSCDGQTRMKAPLSSTVKIHKKSKQLQLIHPQDYDYYSTLRQKLGWEKQAKREN